MIKLCYPDFWQTRNMLAYLLLPFGWIFLFLGYLRRLFATSIKFDAFTICVGNCTVGGTGKTQLIIAMAKEFAKRNINFIILSKGYGGNVKTASLVTASSSPEEVGDEALELCHYGNSFVVPNMKEAIPIISKYKPDIILVDDGMQNPYFKKDLVIMTIDGIRGFGNMMPIPAGPMRTSIAEALVNNDIIVINGSSTNLEVIDKTQLVFHADIEAKYNFGIHEYYAFAGIGNPEKFFLLLKKLGAKVAMTKIFPDHYNYSREDLENIMSVAKKNNLRIITTRKDYVKLNNLSGKTDTSFSLIPAFVAMTPKDEKRDDLLLNYLEVDLKIENQKKFFDLVLAKYNESLDRGNTKQK